MFPHQNYEPLKVNRNLLSLRDLDVKFIYSEKATKFNEIFPCLLTTVHTVKSKGKISQNFVAFSEYMNFKHESKLLGNLCQIYRFIFEQGEYRITF